MMRGHSEKDFSFVVGLRKRKVIFIQICNNNDMINTYGTPNLNYRHY